MGRKKVLIADDHQVVIGGIKSTLIDYPEYEIIGEASNGRDAVRLTRALDPDIVIMDVSMPDLNGIDATMQIKRHRPKVKIVIFTMYSDREYVVDLLRAGVSAYVLKEDPMSDLLAALEQVSRGKTYFSTTAPRVEAEEVDSEPLEDSRNGFKDLSLREREILQLLAEGNPIRDIAAKLGLSPKTVESHKYNIMEKLKANTLADLTKAALRKKLIQP